MTSSFRLRGAASAALAAALLTACGGGGDPLSNPGNVSNPVVSGGEALSFVYFQRCIFPIFLEQIPITQNGVTSTNTCSGAGCHDSNTGTGGALRVIVGAADITNADILAAASATDLAVLQATDMYKNFYSAQGVTVFGSPLQSRLFEKPLVLGVLHGGGRIFASQDDAHAKLIAYWINHPVTSGSEFSTSAYTMFTPALSTTDTTTWAASTCNTQ
jgi:hypothetical protein